MEFGQSAVFCKGYLWKHLWESFEIFTNTSSGIAVFSILNQKNPKKHFTNVVNHWLLLAFRELAHLLKIFIIFLFIIKYIEFFVVQNTKQSFLYISSFLWKNLHHWFLSYLLHITWPKFSVGGLQLGYHSNNRSMKNIFQVSVTLSSKRHKKLFLKPNNKLF